MAGFIQGLDRHQSVQFPARLEDYINEENPVRVVDAYIESLDLLALGFDCAEPAPKSPPRYRSAEYASTDPDARSMATSGKGTGVVGYSAKMMNTNVQPGSG